MKNKDKFHIGQELWFAGSSGATFRGRQHSSTVKTIGRKYITTENGNCVDLNTMKWIEKGYGYQGEFYFSEQEMKDIKLTQVNLSQIKSILHKRYSYDDARFTLDQTERILAILNEGTQGEE